VTELQRVGADLSRGETEGVILQKIGGRWYLLDVWSRDEV
jgi:hypothetical protein